METKRRLCRRITAAPYRCVVATSTWQRGGLDPRSVLARFREWATRLALWDCADRRRHGERGLVVVVSADGSFSAGRDWRWWFRIQDRLRNHEHRPGKEQCVGHEVNRRYFL